MIFIANNLKLLRHTFPSSVMRGMPACRLHYSRNLDSDISLFLFFFISQENIVHLEEASEFD